MSTAGDLATLASGVSVDAPLDNALSTFAQHGSSALPWFWKAVAQRSLDGSRSATFSSPITRGSTPDLPVRRYSEGDPGALAQPPQVPWRHAEDATPRCACDAGYASRMPFALSRA